MPETTTRTLQAMRSPREHCLKILTAMHGPGAMPFVLNTLQPALGDKTIAELLQNQPEELLERLLKFQPEEIEG